MPNFSGMWTQRQQLQATGATTWPAVPGAPTIGTATATSGTTASVGFTAPSNTGYPAGITGYTVTSSPGGLTGTGASSPITVSGLTTGTAYTFTVTATNATGTGPASAASNSVTPPFTYIEDVFSPYVYTGNGSTQTITNGIDLSTNGGLVWTKSRNNGGSSNNNNLVDTARGVSKRVLSELTNSQQSYPGYLTSAFNTNGFAVTDNSAGLYSCNGSSVTYTSWTFRKQPKFFDIVTYTGTGSAQAIAHSLGATPGCMIVKCTSSAESWVVYHQNMQPGSPAYNYFMYLNSTDASTGYSFWNSTAPTSTDFTVGTANQINQSGATYVAYLFASNAGGFGASGTDNVITCGTYTGTGSGSVAVTLGYEPQWLLIKASNISAKNWWIIDNMRGMPVGSNDEVLAANLSDAAVSADLVSPTATGFEATNTSQSNITGAAYIYVAIRRGPMKVPTSGTTVFLPSTYTGTGATAQITNVPFAPDTLYSPGRGPSGATDRGWYDRLRGINNPLQTNSAGAEDPTYTDTVTAYNNNGVSLGGSYAFVNSSGSNYIEYFFGRAPGFYDEVCYTGNGTAGRAINHNLAATPELMIVKSRSDGSAYWTVASGITSSGWDFTKLNTTDAASNQPYSSSNIFTAQPTSTTFTVGSFSWVNASSQTYVAYLFATCAGVSQVGSYTGNATLTTINCGFTGGARFVMIKRTDTTGNWFMWDTARGMTAGTDPSSPVNSATAETNANSVYTITTGFQLLASPSADVNTSGGTYIYLAIA